MKEIRLATKILQTTIKDRIQYSGRLIVDTVGISARCGILLLLYSSVYQLNNGIINGNTFLFTAWSILFYFLFSVLRLRDVAREIMKDIQSGNIEVLLSKPISYLSYRIWWQIGSGIYSFVIISIISVFSLYLIVGIPETLKQNIFISTFAITFIGGAILSLLLYAIVGLLAFWIEDIDPVFWVVDKSIMILGGSYLPISLFPEIMYKISVYSPFGASQFITHTVYQNWANNWFQLLVVQFIWIILFSLIIYFIFDSAKKKVSVNGG